MTGKSRQAVRMSKLLEKSKHVNIESLEDVTIVNYLRLLECIVDKNQHKMSYYIADLENYEESTRRMKEIDRLRTAGKMTDAERMQLNLELDRRQSAVLNEIKRIPITPIYPKCRTKVTNEYADTVEEFETLKAACDEYDLNYKNVKSYFSMNKSNTIKYKGLIIEKMRG